MFPCRQGNEVRVDGNDIGVRDPIPAGPQGCAEVDPAGANIIRYGQVIGRARIPIEPGQHVHTHNVAFEELTFDYEFPVGERKLENTPRERPDIPRVCARGRPRRHAQLHRRGRGQQLRRAHGGADRAQASAR